MSVIVIHRRIRGFPKALVRRCSVEGLERGVRPARQARRIDPISQHARLRAAAQTSAGTCNWAGSPSQMPGGSAGDHGGGWQCRSMSTFASARRMRTRWSMGSAGRTALDPVLTAVCWFSFRIAAA